MSHKIINIRHPQYFVNSLDWETWRDTFEGGEYYRDHYLFKFSGRETDAEFKTRKAMTPIPSFAKAAVLDVRNSIYQRLVGVIRNGGSQTYKQAVDGIGGGVDGTGKTMDAFIGKDVLTELLVMGKVGVYIDAAPPRGETLADPTFPPYLTYYRVEDILSYTYSPRGEGGEFAAVLLRDWNVSVSTNVAGIELPSGTETRYRLLWKDDNGDVWYRQYDEDSNPIISEDTSPDGAVLTGLKRIPFVLMDIGESLLKDVSSYQQALLNLISSDVYYAIKSNAPFLVIQKNASASGSHLKRDESQGDEDHAEQMGSGKGRYYGMDEEKPAFIAPPVAPLEASMQLQERMEDNIRTLINLSVQNKAGSRTESAESKKISSQGLEAGLSFIGMVLEQGERTIAQSWAEYENTVSPDPALIHYPDRYVLKSDQERIEEADKTVTLISRLPGHQMRKEVAKQLVDSLLDGKVDRERMNEIKAEIDRAKYITASDVQWAVIEAHKSGLVDDKTAAETLGYDSSVVEQAREDRAERIQQTLEAQTAPGEIPENPEARGIPELDTNLNSAEEEREEATE